MDTTVGECEALFAQASELAAGAVRDRFLAERCGANAALRREVESRATLSRVALFIFMVGHAFLAKPQEAGRRPIVAIVGYTSSGDSGYSNLPPMRPTIEFSIPQSLALVKGLHLLPEIDSAMEEVRVHNLDLTVDNQLRKIGAFADADFVLAGSERRDDQGWKVNTRIINVKSGEATESQAESTNWFDLQQQVVEGILGILKIVPRPEELARLRAFWKTPEPVVRRFFDANIMLSQGEAALSESNLQAIVKTDPMFPDVYALLAAVDQYQGNLKGAEEFAQRALALNPDSWVAHKMLGIIFASEKKDGFLDVCNGY